MKVVTIAWALLMTSFIGSLAQAQDLNFSQYRRFLMNGTQGAGPKMALQTTCTNSKGQVYRIGEKGYDTCLSSIKKQTNPSTTGTNTTIHIGN